MIDKKYLFNNKSAENYVKVHVESKSARLADLYEAIDSKLGSEISEDVYITSFSEESAGIYELTLCVDDVDFSEFED